MIVVFSIFVSSLFCLSTVFLSFCLTVYPSVCPSVCPLVCPSVCPSACPSVVQSVRLSDYLWMNERLLRCLLVFGSSVVGFYRNIILTSLRGPLRAPLSFSDSLKMCVPLFYLNFYFFDFKIVPLKFCVTFRCCPAAPDHRIQVIR